MTENLHIKDIKLPVGYEDCPGRHHFGGEMRTQQKNREIDFRAGRFPDKSPLDVWFPGLPKKMTGAPDDKAVILVENKVSRFSSPGSTKLLGFVFIKVFGSFVTILIREKINKPNVLNTHNGPNCLLLPSFGH